MISGERTATIAAAMLRDALTGGLARAGPHLEITGGPDRGAALSLRQGWQTLGRGAAADHPIDDAEVSRLHARVLLEGGAAWIDDLGSRNGVWVRGGRLSGRVPLLPGETVRLGNSELTFRSGVLASDDGEATGDLPATGLTTGGASAGPLLGGAGAGPSLGDPGARSFGGPPIWWLLAAVVFSAASWTAAIQAG
jgi:pSer/pThr/pTyr-binding forkhead associated (FHA) protein